MRKLTLTGLLVLFAQQAFSQAASNTQLINLFNKVDSTLILYIKSSRFVNPLSGDKIDARVMQDFKNLFMADAMIIDEIVPAYYDGNFTDPENLVTRSVEDYSKMVSTNFPNGLNVTLLNANISYSELASNKVTLVLEKIVKGKTQNGLRIENHDTIEMDLVVSPDYQNVKISAIRLIGHSLTFSNDMDRDFKWDEIDKCPKKPGYSREDGCPEVLAKVEKPKPVKPEKPEKPAKPEKPERPASEKPDIVLAFNVFTGTSKSTFDFEDNTNSMYINAADFSSNKNAKPEISGLKTLGFDLGLGLFLDSKNRLGIGAGVQFQSIGGTIKKTGYDITFKATDQFGEEYKQHIFATGNNTLIESFKAKQLSIPIFLILRPKITDKIRFQIDAGLNLGLSFKGTSKADDNFKLDYEAVYHYDKASARYTYSTNENPESDWYMTREHVSRYAGGESGLDANFTRWRNEGYNVGLNQSMAGSSENTKFEYKPKAGLLIRPSIQFSLNERISLGLGIVYMTNAYSNKADTKQYYLAKEVGKYHTMMNSLDNYKTTTFGFNLGLRYVLN